MGADFDLSREVIVVTGGGGILGGRFAEALLRYGARVALVDRDLGKTKAVAQSLGAKRPDHLIAYEFDVTSGEAMSELRRQVEQDFGAVTVLVNNAAAKSPSFFEPFETFPVDEWEQVMRVNVTGAMLTSREFGRAMADQGRGSIINILSIYGIVAPDQRIYEGSQYEGRAISTPAVYSASKAGLWGLTRYLSTYWANKGVRVNAVTPGGVFSGQNDTFVRRYSQRVPMGRMADRDDISGAVVYLAAPASAYVTGQNIIVDGGLTAW